MSDKNNIYRAIHNVGGPTAVAILLKVSTQTVHRWISLGYIPKFDKAQKLAKATGFAISVLRPTYSPRRFGLLGSL